MGDDDSSRRGSSSSSAAAEEGREDRREKMEELEEDMEKVPYPKCVFFILSTEACERFSFYGMRAILSLYLKHLFILDGMEADQAEDTATILYHTFNFLCYLTSLFGAFLADSFLGKYRTIFYISIVYVIGQGTLAFGAVPGSPDADGIEGLPQQAISYVGLILIAFGTGGIKPCVVSFGADQFKLPQQKSEMSTFFGIFYASINFGSMISTILTPIFRKQSCMGEDECYSLAFGVPAALMFVALVFFVMGRPWYKIAMPERNVVLDFFKAMTEAIKQKRKSDEKRDHWMDYARERFGKTFVSDVKAVLRVCVLFLTYPFFWALYDQQGSRWTFQATRMDGKIGGIWILPDQMQVINAALILVYIPIFDKGIYPLANKFGLLRTPLQKIITGGTLVGVAFIASALVELQLEDTYPAPPDVDEARLNFHNGLSLDNAGCNIQVDFIDPPGALPEFNIGAGSSYPITNEDDDELVPFDVVEDIGVTLQVHALVDDKDACGVPLRGELNFNVSLVSENGTNVWFYSDKQSLQAYVSKFTDEADKSETGYPWMRPIFFLPGMQRGVNIMIVGEDYDPEEDGEISAEFDIQDNLPLNDLEAYESEKMGDLKVCLEDYLDMDAPLCEEDSSGQVVFREYKYGGSYNFYITVSGEGSDAEPFKLRVDVEDVIEPNSIHMMWLLPQYMILTAGEVLFSITSLAFSFTQAPESMKAVLQSLYLMTTAIGNLIDIIVIGAVSDLFNSQAHEFFLFAGLMFLDMAVLMWLAMRYEYVDYTSGTRPDLSRSSSMESVAKSVKSGADVPIGRERRASIAMSIK